MSILSRRSIVASAAALPALAVSAVAASPTIHQWTVEPDPIFAALKACDAAAEAENAGYDARSNADDGFKAKYGGYKPSGLTKEAKEEGRMDRFWLSQHSWIRQNTKQLPRHAVAELHRELNRQEADYDLTVRPVHEAADAAFERRYSAMEMVFATPPTTVAGFRALIDFAMSESFVTECLTETQTDEPLRDFLNTLYESAQSLAVQS
jgi:hypothetical protein